MPLTPLKASRFLECMLLLSEEGIKELLAHLKCHVRNVSKLLAPEEADDYTPQFLKAYQTYLAARSQSEVDPRLFRSELACGLSLDPSAYQMEVVTGGKCIVRPLLPVVQVALLQFCLSEEGKVLSHVLGSTSISFGLHFTYPQLYRDPHTKTEKNALKEGVNAPLWKALNAWVRSHTQLLKIMRGHEIIKTSIHVDTRCRDSILKNEKRLSLCLAPPPTMEHPK